MWSFWHLQEKLAYEQELQKKNQTIEKLTAENQQLLYKSTDEKDAKIVELQGEVDRLRQSQDTQDVICQSLSEETITLKERLRKTAEVCQHLVRQLEQMSVEKQEPDTLGLSLDRVSIFLIYGSTLNLLGFSLNMTSFFTIFWSCEICIMSSLTFISIYWSKHLVYRLTK